ncbi:MAG: bifunctional phosphopantothenoylcysteine decarboxylase/phosphopantothenate--cysteine ligase CoaBC [Myxococcota bacterium]
MERKRVLLAVSGGIAAYKVPELVRLLDAAGLTVRCALTEAATRFVSPLVLQTLTREPVRSELLDPGEEGRIGHIDLADQADAVVVAPATANLLARMAAGLADDLVSTVLLATRAPVLVAPAMNVNMWEHPATRANVATLRERGVRFVGPDSGALACGWEGAGRMAEPAAIAAALERLLSPASLAGERVVVSAGGTREPIDAVRAIVNRSSGKTGFALAAEAARRGAEVVLVAGPSALATPAGVERRDVETALEMRTAVREAFAEASVAIMAAAVADFRPAAPLTGKLKKEDLPDDAGLELSLVRNPDILAELAGDRGDRLVVGFAAESQDVIAAARRKLARKGCDLLVANDVSRTDAGFESDRNAVALLTPDGDVEELPLLDKREVAARIWDRIEKLRGARRA